MRHGGQMAEISIIVPAHNVAEYVSQTLESLWAQDKVTFEVLVIDDGSTDGTLDILHSYERRFQERGISYQVIVQPQGGAGSARNAGLRRASGRLIGFLDADDVLHGGALFALVAEINRRGCDLVFPLCRHIDAKGVPTGVTSHVAKNRYSAADLIVDNPIHSGSGVVVQAERAAQTGFFDMGLPACIDLDYWVRLTEGRGEAIGALDSILVDYRTRPGQITGNWRRMRKGWESVVAKAFRRDKIEPSAFNKMARARNLLVWATAAYKNRDYAATRRLMAECCRADPIFALKDKHARIRVAAALISLLPTPLHRTLQERFNG